MTTSRFFPRPGLDVRRARSDDVVPADLPAPPPDQDTPRWCRSVVALDHGRVVGVGTVAEAPLTESYLVEVHVSPGHRRHGVATALVQALRDLTSEPLSLQGRVMASQPWRRAFAESLGCTTRMRYPGPWIDPTSAAGRAWAAAQPVPAGYSVRSMADSEREDVVEAWKTYVAWAQRPFGVVRTERILDTWPAYAERIDPTVSMVATDDDGRVVAFSLVTPDGWQGRTFVVSETTDREQADGDALLRATVAASVRALDARGVRLVELEGHSTDPHSPALVRSLPPAGGDPTELVELPAPVPAGASRS